MSLLPGLLRDCLGKLHEENDVLVLNSCPRCGAWYLDRRSTEGLERTHLAKQLHQHGGRVMACMTVRRSDRNSFWSIRNSVLESTTVQR